MFTPGAVLGLILSLLWGLAIWLFLQAKKERDQVLIPRGVFTVRYGAPLGATCGTMCVFMLVASVLWIHWWSIISLLLVWFGVSRVTAYIERVCYARDRLGAFPALAKRMAERYGHDDALCLWNSVMPRWWINMMSSRWEQEYKRGMGSIL